MMDDGAVGTKAGTFWRKRLLVLAQIKYPK